VSLRAYFNILLLAICLSALVGLIAANNQRIDFHYILGSSNGPAWTYLLLAFIAGMVASSLLLVYGGTGWAVRRWREKQAARATSELSEIYRRGTEASYAGRKLEARDQFSEILQRNPNDRRALLRLGDVERDLANFEAAVSAHRRALELRPDDLQARYALYRDFRGAENLPAAKAALREILELDKRTNLPVYRELRDLLLKEENWEELASVQEQTLKLAAPAEREAEQALLLGVQYQLGLRDLNEAEFKGAVQRLRRLIKESPQFVPGYLALGDALRKLAQAEEAISVWNDGFESTHSWVLLQRIEDEYLSREQPAAAIDYHRRAIRRLSGSEAILGRFLLGRLYYRLEMIDEALHQFESIKREILYSPTLHYYLAKIKQRRGEDHAAAQEFKELIKQFDLLQPQIACSACDYHGREWRDRCPSCGAWNTLRLDLSEELSQARFEQQQAPVRTGA